MLLTCEERQDESLAHHHLGLMYNTTAIATITEDDLVNINRKVDK